MTWVLVGSGGALGALVRHAVTRWVLSSLAVADFPTAIFLINVGGSGLIGVIAGVVAADRLSISPEVRTFLTVGFLGGFTTFSSFSLDTLTLMKAGDHGMAAVNIVGQVGLSLVAVWLGYRCGLWL